MHKLERIAQLLAYRDTPRIVFERRVVGLKLRDSAKPLYRAQVRYWKTTTTYEIAKGEGKTPLKAVRAAWKAAKQDYEKSWPSNMLRYEAFVFDETQVSPTENIEALGHNLSLDRDGFFRCSICAKSYLRIPDGHFDKCPQAPIFHGLWDKAFKEAEETLGFKPLTKKQLDQAGYQTGKNLPKPCAAFDYSDNPNGYLLAYNPAEAVPKKTMTEAQKAAIEKANYMAQRVVVPCIRCENRELVMTRKKSLDPKWQTFICDTCGDGLDAAEWAYKVMAEPEKYCVLDSETTDYTGEMIEVGILDLVGNVLLNQRIKPIGEMSEGAFAVHGISLEMLANEPTFPEVYPRILEAIGDKTLLIYNASFDMGILWGDCKRYDLKTIKNETECMMHWYAQFYGDWSNYWGNYKWQSLWGGDHSAIGDCRATLSLLRMMAKDWETWQTRSSTALISG
jgi:hypothetical protein